MKYIVFRSFHDTKPAIEWFNVLFYFFCLCPFLSPTPLLGTDVQPYALILSVGYIAYLFFIKSKRIEIENRKILVLGISFLIALFFAFGSTDDKILNILRGISNYASLFFITFATYIITKRNHGLNEQIAKIILVLWFFVGLIQFLFMKDFLNSIISGGRTDGTRGVFGLASEPSFFGVQCFYFFFLIRSFSTNKALYFGLILIMSFIFAQSALGILFVSSLFFILVIESLIIKNRFWVVLLLLGSLILSIYFIVNYMEGTRISQLLQMLLNRNVAGLSEDESIMIRTNSIMIPLKEFSANYFIPHSFQSRIGSAFAGILYELGIFAFGITFVIPAVLSGFFSGNTIRILCFSLTFILFFSNIQLSNPTLAFVLGFGMYYNKSRRLLPLHIIHDTSK